MDQNLQKQTFSVGSGFAGAQPRLTQNAAPLAFCRLRRRSLSLQWTARQVLPALALHKKNIICQKTSTIVELTHGFKQLPP